MMNLVLKILLSTWSLMSPSYNLCGIWDRKRRRQTAGVSDRNIQDQIQGNDEDLSCSLSPGVSRGLNWEIYRRVRQDHYSSGFRALRKASSCSLRILKSISQTTTPNRV